MVAAWRVRALCLTGDKSEAEALMDRTPLDTRAWPNIRVRTDIARGRANQALGRADHGLLSVQGALKVAEANGYRLYQLHAHHLLVQFIEDEAQRARHQRVARALARSLAANLPRADGQAFLTAGFGDVE